MNSLEILEVTECLLCNKGLGADSRAEGFMFCHEHRICISCGEKLLAPEAKLCFKKFLEASEPGSIDYTDIEIICVRCSASKHTEIIKDQTKIIPQSEFDYLNLIRLMTIPNTDLSQITNENNARLYSSQLLVSMNFEQKTLHLKMIQAVMAHVGDMIKKDPNYKKEFLAEREKERFDSAKLQQAQQQAAKANKHTSSTKSSTKTSEELSLGVFMTLHGLTDKDTAAKILKDRNKSITSLIKLGIPEVLAREQCDSDLVKNGRLPK